MLKIDVFNHMLPKPYYDKMMELRPGLEDIGKRMRNIPVIANVEMRLEQLEEFGDDYYQVLSLAAPAVEAILPPDQTPDLIKIGNDEMARLVDEHDKFVGFIASLPMNNIEATKDEIRRSVEDLGATGIQVFTNVAGKPLDADEFLPVFEMMHSYDLPIWVHPTRGADMVDYPGEKKSHYEIWWTFGWPYETSVMQARLVFSGYFDKFPGLKVLTHHLGGMTPYFEGRVGPGMDQLGARTSDEDLSLILKKLEKRPLDYFKGFLADTATFGSRGAMICGLEFYGADNVMFASDSPFDPEKGPGYIRETINILDNLDISDEDRAKIYHGNAQRLLKLKM